MTTILRTAAVNRHKVIAHGGGKKKRERERERETERERQRKTERERERERETALSLRERESWWTYPDCFLVKSPCLSSHPRRPYPRVPLDV